MTNVYRTLQVLADAGGVDVLRTDEGESVYRQCSAGHHHHLVCRTCGRTVEVAGPAVERWADQVAAEHGFTDVRHTVRSSAPARSVPDLHRHRQSQRLAYRARMTEISGARVLLRSLVADDIEPLVAGGVDDGSLTRRSPEQLRERLRDLVTRKPTLEDGGFVTLGVEVAGALVGEIQARNPKNCFPPGVCEIGITLFSTARGQGWGAEAVDLFTSHLLRERWERVQAATACDNAAMRRVLERAGYRYEGVLRAFAPGEDGGRADYAMYAATRG